MVERYAIKEEERKKVLSTYFKEGIDGKLDVFPISKNESGLFWNILSNGLNLIEYTRKRKLMIH